MKKVCFVINFLMGIFLLPSNVLAEEVHIYLFYGNTCHFCEEEREYFVTLKKEYPDVVIHEFEVFENTENEANMLNVKEMYNISRPGVPFTVVGDTAMLGFNTSTQDKIERAIEKYQKEDYYDRVGVYLGLYEDEKIIEDDAVTDSTNKEDGEESADKKSSVAWPFYLSLVVLFCSFVLGVICYKQRVKK